MTNKNIEIIVFGRVQGVGFRYSTKKVADRMNLNGFVQNLRDGSVLIHVNGETSIVDEFVSKIKDSPTSYGRVDNMKITNINEIHDKGFIIK
ncbi:acylphosphatase [Apilactobacillus kunkeei]|uniref:acylphosphatase n=1 Tax=Apilactobacillus kunkeei TaxID=148814 RepID=UPI0006B23CE9|nr:acylphosphatase [Apilactobacillus kunkeei]KOY69774.1 Acylphosphatase [Apilactobacillus kunkeei]MCK8629526.1 acylphosphatase [Apilactobacillus kunkeei]MCK8633708.1 acylphosphatase [Apilactobacillus kunkeei]TMS99441.1 acylphosphatase [Apilactobacillus kunkeei]CAI2599771.1 Acylphosphatase [Apilactobacillus kunkeei]